MVLMRAFAILVVRTGTFDGDVGGGCGGFVGHVVSSSGGHTAPSISKEGERVLRSEMHRVQRGEGMSSCTADKTAFANEQLRKRSTKDRKTYDS